MKKYIAIIISALFLTLPDIYAQNKETKIDQWVETTEGDDETGHYILETTYERGVYFTSSFWSNWTVSASLGTQFYVGDNDWKANFADWFTFPSIDIHADKWVSPSFGYGLNFNYSPFAGIYQANNLTASFRTDEFYKTYKTQELYRQKANTFQLSVYPFFDLRNFIDGYEPDRIYSPVFFIGGGLLYAKDDDQPRWGASISAGIYNIFHLTNSIDISANLRMGLVSDTFDGESRLNDNPKRRNKQFDLSGGANIGLTYHFGEKNRKKEWTRASSTTKTYSDYAAVKEEVVALKEDNKILEEKVNEKDTIIIKEPLNLWYHVQFTIDKWNISKRELVNLSSIAAIIKAVPDTKFQVCGYADIQTATPEHNLVLSKNRATQVYKVLVEEFGVNPEQLSVDYKGGVDSMFYGDHTLTRCVIIKTI